MIVLCTHHSDRTATVSQLIGNTPSGGHASSEIVRGLNTMNAICSANQNITPHWPSNVRLGFENIEI